MERIDVAIIGGGPAGLQAALVLARTRKKVVVFDAPTPPRNAASHGVHNFVGLDGLLPQEIREQAWEQIRDYSTARLVQATVTSVDRSEVDDDLVVEADGATWKARHVVLTAGYRDIHPEIDGFEACWAKTIIPCPFCDGYENRDRRWGIVPSMSYEIDVFPSMSQNWTDDRVVIAPRDLAVTTEQRAMLTSLGVDLHVGDIRAIHHTDGHLTGVTLDSGAHLDLGTLLFTPEEAPVPLIERMTKALGLELDEHGYVAVDASQRTNVDRLWAAGDVQGWMGAIEAANAGGMAASMIVHGWFDPADTESR